MRKICIILFYVCSFISTSSQGQNSKIKKKYINISYDLKKERDSIYKKGNISDPIDYAEFMQEFPNKYFIYDKNEHVIEDGDVEFQTESTVLIKRNSYKYDDDNNLIEHINLSRDSKFYSSNTYKYQKGKLIEKNFDVKDNNTVGYRDSYSTMRYESKENEVIEYYFEKKDSNEFEFDHVKIEEKNSKGQVEYIEYRDRSKVYLSEEYFYNDLNQIVQNESIDYRLSGIDKRIEKTAYSDTGKIIKNDVKNYESDSLTYFITDLYKYDSKDNEIQKIELNNDKIIKKWTFQYVYDVNNNWINKLIFLDEKPLYFVERQIEYY
jgi:hypothetical protein